MTCDGCIQVPVLTIHVQKIETLEVIGPSPVIRCPAGRKKKKTIFWKQKETEAKTMGQLLRRYRNKEKGRPGTMGRQRKKRNGKGKI